MRLLLFDLDATLMSSGGAGLKSMARAISERFGVECQRLEVLPDGKTDPAILREVLRNHRLPVEDEDRAVAELGVLYERYLREEMPRAAKARLLPGVVELLDELSLRSGVLLGLLTGNYEATARIKLSQFDLNRFFRFGAFASDDECRDRLVPIAVRRAEALTGATIGIGRHVLVIGDTPRDVGCALAHQVTAIGVATGRYPVEALLAAGAHLAFRDLSDTHQVAATLCGIPGADTA